MSELRLSPRGWQNVRFALSPVWEAALSVRAFTDASARATHGPWVEEARGRLAGSGVDVALLATLVPPAGWYADFLTPVPRVPSPTFADELERVAATGAAGVRADLANLARNPGADRATLERLAADPETTLARAVEALRGWWEETLAGYWGRLHGLLAGDIDYRLRLLADAGASEMVATLHPWVVLDDHSVRIPRLACDDVDVDPGAGLLLVPCAFAWPRVYTRHDGPARRMLSYSPRGIGNLWAVPQHGGDGLGPLLGATRARLLAFLDLPMTTSQLACHFDLAPATVSKHLSVLHDAGLLRRHARGRHVFYERGELGEALLGR